MMIAIIQLTITNHVKVIKKPFVNMLYHIPIVPTINPQ